MQPKRCYPRINDAELQNSTLGERQKEMASSSSFMRVPIGVVLADEMVDRQESFDSSGEALNAGGYRTRSGPAREEWSTTRNYFILAKYSPT